MKLNDYLIASSLYTVQSNMYKQNSSTLFLELFIN